MIEVAAAVIFSGNKLLLSSRPVDKPPAGWEFPGGKLEPGESVSDAAKRELKEELDLNVIPGKILYRVTAGHLAINFILCSIQENSVPQAKENQEFKWVDAEDQAPAGLLKNDLECWDFMIRNKINHIVSPL
jgi:mutator protein MutT